MSYGPIWYEWRKRPLNEADTADFIGEGNTHTRHGVGKTLATELFWCQPGLYHGAPGFTNTKVSKLIATIYETPYCTNDESGDRVYVKSYGFMEASILQKAVDYALSKETTPQTDQPGLASQAEYVPGQDYPCMWCGRSADKDCAGYYDPTCGDKDGQQHRVANAIRVFDSRCQATCTQTRRDGKPVWTGASASMEGQCYNCPGHEGEHRNPINAEMWAITDWVLPSAEELAVMRAKVISDALEQVARCSRGEMTGDGLRIEKDADV